MEREFSTNDWERYAACYDVLNELRPYADMLEDVLAALRNSRYPLLDAGCGTGNLIARLSSDRASKVVGVDASVAMLARASVKCPHAEFWLTDLNATLPFDDSSFGTLVCVNALYAVTDPARTLAEFKRVLRPAGSLTIATPRSEYENGLILKAHCRSRKSDAYWSNVHGNPVREKRLVREAIGNPDIAEHMLHIARFNRTIAQERAFTFFSQAALLELAGKVGFVGIRIKETYAGQNLLLSCERPREHTR